MSQNEEQVTVWYLETTSPEQLNPKPPVAGIEVKEAKTRQWQLNRFLYQLVGDAWQWHDKLKWTDKQWQEYAEMDNLRTWVAFEEGSPAGYFELGKLEEDRVEICYFGLAGKFIGRGLGGYLLTRAMEEAWAWGAKRVIVNTCSLDHPSALANYQSRGMQIYKTEEKLQESEG